MLKFKKRDKEFIHKIYPYLDVTLINKAYDYSNMNNERVDKFVKAAIKSFGDNKFNFDYERKNNPREKIYIKLNANHFDVFSSFEPRKRSEVLERIIGTYINKLERTGE